MRVSCDSNQAATMLMCVEHQACTHVHINTLRSCSMYARAYKGMVSLSWGKHFRNMGTIVYPLCMCLADVSNKTAIGGNVCTAAKEWNTEYDDGVMVMCRQCHQLSWVRTHKYCSLRLIAEGRSCLACGIGYLALLFTVSWELGVAWPDRMCRSEHAGDRQPFARTSWTMRLEVVDAASVA